MMNPFRTGKIVLFQTSYDRDWQAWELVFFVLLGVIGGVLGHWIVRLNTGIAALRSSHVFWNGKNAFWMDWFRQSARLILKSYVWLLRMLEKGFACIYGTPDRIRSRSDSLPISPAISLAMSSTAESIDSQIYNSPISNSSFRSRLQDHYEHILTIIPRLPAESNDDEAQELGKRWWTPSSTKARRFFQEVVILTVITSFISYGSIFMRHDMTDLLSGLLRECNVDMLQVGRRSPVLTKPNVPTVVGSGASVRLPQFKTTFGNTSMAKTNFTRLRLTSKNPSPSHTLVTLTNQLFKRQSDTEDEDVDPGWDGISLHGVIGEQEDVYGLCYNDERLDSTSTFKSLFWTLLLTASLRMLLTVITFGVRIPAGMFIPAMVIGAQIGRAMGMLVREAVLQASNASSSGDGSFSADPDRILTAATTIITPGTYALVGAASVLGGVSRLTVSVCVIMFEITGGAALTYVVPLMLAIMMAKTVADSLDRHFTTSSNGTTVKSPGLGGIANAYIALLKYPFLDQRRDWHFFDDTVVHVAPEVDGSEENLGATHEKHLYRTITVSKWMTPVSQLTYLAVFESEPRIVHVDNVGVTAESTDSFYEFKNTQPTFVREYIPAQHSLATLEALISDSAFQSIPLVLSEDRMVYCGVLRRIDIIAVLKKARKRFLDSETLVYLTNQKHPINFTLAENNLVAASVPWEVDGQFRLFVNMSDWVDWTMLSVGPHYPMDLMLAMFKNLGIRVIIITNEGSSVLETSNAPGSLIGLMTKKDLLRAIDLEESANQSVDRFDNTPNPSYSDLPTYRRLSMPALSSDYE